MFITSPAPTTTIAEVSHDNQFGIGLDFQNKEVPEKQRTFLERFGWVEAGFHPDTQESLFRKPCPAEAPDEVRRSWDYELRSGYWYWYEAVAYEFTKFIGIGDDSGMQRNGDGASSA